MISNLYLICLIISMVVLMVLASKDCVNTDRYLWTILLMLPIVILGYWLKSTVHSSEAAMIAFCFIYLESTVLPVVVIFAILNTLNIKIGRWAKIIAYTIASLHLLCIWNSIYNHLYYESMILTETALGTSTKMVGGPFKVTHYIYLGVVFTITMVTIMAGFLKKGTFSRRVFHLYTILPLATIVLYIVEMAMEVSFSMIPLLYVIIAVLIMFNFDQFNNHDIRKLIDSKQTDDSKHGYVAFDLKRRFLGYTLPALRYSEDIRNLIIDSTISKQYQTLANCFNTIIDDFEDSDISTSRIEKDNKIFTFIVTKYHTGDFSISKGYLIEIVDITEETRHLQLIETYNRTLGEEIEQKTAQVVDIQNKVVLGLADMVENRDDNTGGHIKRTSSVIQILLEEAIKQKTEGLDRKKAKDIMRAAPMHDLGKMSIDNSILCKPGRLTDEEFAIMKTHSTKSGEIVKIILEGVEEEQFVEVAYNVARYHHERWDGKGYPEGLLGENIPLEARFLAVVDVYDALVSKRCYKEAMSFEQAYKIMMECMGSQFDPSMRPIFVACRDKLEEYYSKQ